MDVGYVLEGGIQKSGSRIRLNAQLIDIASGDHIWADRYDREVADVFLVQDEISQAIVTELNVKLVEGEYARLYARPNMDARVQELLLQTVYALRQFTRADNARGQRLANLGLVLDSENAPMMALLAWLLAVAAFSGWCTSSNDTYKKAFGWAENATERDSAYSMAWSVRGYMLAIVHEDWETGERYIRDSVDLDPSDAVSLANSALPPWWRGDGQRVIEISQAAINLVPVTPPMMLLYLGAGRYLAGQLQEAIAELEECTRQLPDYIWPRMMLAEALIESGRKEEAHEHGRHVLRINPGYTVDTHIYPGFYRDPAQRERSAELLRRAGLP